MKIRDSSSCDAWSEIHLEKSPRGGGQKHVRRHFGGGGGGACVQWAVFNFEGLQFPRGGGGGHKVFKGGQCPAPPK